MDMARERLKRNERAKKITAATAAMPLLVPVADASGLRTEREHSAPGITTI